MRLTVAAGEVLVVDNGSHDRSATVAQGSGARVVLEPRQGYGAALCRGFREATGEFVVIGDCDESYDFNDVGRFLERLREGADLVIGNRFAGGVMPGAMPWLHRWIGNPLLSFLVNAMYGAGVRDSQSGMRGLTKATLRKLNLHTSGMEFASEMIVKAAIAGLRIDEIPIVLARDGRNRAPHLRSFRDGWRHLRLILVLGPLWLFVLPGLGAALIGLVALLLLLLAPDEKLGDAIGPNMVFAASLLSVSGAHTALLGVVAKLYAAAMDPVFNDRRFIASISMARGLTAGAGLIAAGAILGLREALSRTGPIDMNRVPNWVIACTLVAFGVQAVFGSFLISIFEMHRAVSPHPAPEPPNTRLG